MNYVPVCVFKIRIKNERVRDWHQHPFGVAKSNVITNYYLSMPGLNPATPLFLNLFLPRKYQNQSHNNQNSSCNR